MLFHVGTEEHRNTDPSDFYITLTGQTLTDLRNHRYAVLAMGNAVAGVDDGAHEFFQELSKSFDEVIEQVEGAGHPTSTEVRIRLYGGDALYLHRSHVHRFQEEKSDGQTRFAEEHKQYADELFYKIDRAGGRPAIELLDEKYSSD